MLMHFHAAVLIGCCSPSLSLSLCVSVSRPSSAGSAGQAVVWVFISGAGGGKMLCLWIHACLNDVVKVSCVCDGYCSVSVALRERDDEGLRRVVVLCLTSISAQHERLTAWLRSLLFSVVRHVPVSTDGFLADSRWCCRRSCWAALVYWFI